MVDYLSHYLHDKKQIGQWHVMELMTQIRGKQRKAQANADGYVDIEHVILIVCKLRTINKNLNAYMLWFK